MLSLLSQHSIRRAALPASKKFTSNPAGTAVRAFTSASSPRLRGFSPISTLPPLPPPEWESDGSPRRYPLNQAIQEHGYTWEHWLIREAGLYHTIYWGDLAVDYTPHGAWLQSIPLWVGAPIVLAFTVGAILILKNVSVLGIKPKRYTIDWIHAQKERERAENSNPVTRYIDRRVLERGHHVFLGDLLPYNYYFAWMNYSFDHEWREERGLEDLTDGETPWSYKPMWKLKQERGEVDE